MATRHPNKKNKTTHFHPYSTQVQQHWNKYPGGRGVGTRGYYHSHTNSNSANRSRRPAAGKNIAIYTFPTNSYYYINFASPVNHMALYNEENYVPCLYPGSFVYSGDGDCNSGCTHDCSNPENLNFLTTTNTTWGILALAGTQYITNPGYNPTSVTDQDGNEITPIGIGFRKGGQAKQKLQRGRRTARSPKSHARNVGVSKRSQFGAPGSDLSWQYYSSECRHSSTTHGFECQCACQSDLGQIHNDDDIGPCSQQAWFNDPYPFPGNDEFCGLMCNQWCADATTTIPVGGYHKGGKIGRNKMRKGGKARRNFHAGGGLNPGVNFAVQQSVDYPSEQNPPVSILDQVHMYDHVLYGKTGRQVHYEWSEPSPPRPPRPTSRKMKKGGRPRKKFHAGGRNQHISANVHNSFELGSGPPVNILDQVHMNQHILDYTYPDSGDYRKGGRIYQTGGGLNQSCPDGNYGFDQFGNQVCM